MNPDPVNKIYFILIGICILLVSGCEKDDFISSQPDSNIIFLSGHLENKTGWELMIMSKDGTNQSRITDMTSIYHKPVVSHSGESVLFIHYSGDAYYELYSVDIDGTNLQLIDRAEKYCGSPDWLSDDSKIVYSKYVDETPGGDSPPLYLHPTNDIVIFDVLTGETRILTDTLNNIFPKFAPDGRIAFTRTTNTSMDIYFMNTDGSGRELILHNASDPIWTTNGEKIVYTGIGDKESQQIFTANGDGSNPVQLTSMAVANYSGTGPPAYGNYNPHWTPDGKKIIYQSDIDSGLPEIWNMKSDGTDKLRLTNSYRNNENPEVSSDGKYILFSSTRNLAYESEIYVMDINGENETPVSKRAGDECFPVYLNK